MAPVADAPPKKLRLMVVGLKKPKKPIAGGTVGVVAKANPGLAIDPTEVVPVPEKNGEENAGNDSARLFSPIDPVANPLPAVAG